MIRKIVFSAISLLAVLVLANCWGTDVEDRDKPVYTWEGRLFGSPSETAWANKEVYLVVYRQKLIQTIRDTLDITVTDENGYFKMEYEELNLAEGSYKEDGSVGRGLGFVELRIAGPSVLEAAYDVDVKRDFCLNQNSVLLTEVLLNEDLSFQDSVYIQLFQAVDLPTNVHDIGNGQYAIVGPMSSGERIEFRLSMGSNFAFLPSKTKVKWGYELNNLKDTIIEVREWPKIDSLTLEF